MEYKEGRVGLEDYDVTMMMDSCCCCCMRVVLMCGLSNLNMMSGCLFAAAIIHCPTLQKSMCWIE